MLRAAVVTSADANVSLASHFSNVPCSATDAFTENLIALSNGTTSNTGASLASCPKANPGRPATNAAAPITPQANALKTESCVRMCVSLSPSIHPCQPSLLTALVTSCSTPLAAPTIPARVEGGALLATPLILPNERFNSGRFVSPSGWVTGRAYPPGKPAREPHSKPPAPYPVAGSVAVEPQCGLQCRSSSPPAVPAGLATPYDPWCRAGRPLCARAAVHGSPAA